MLAAASVCAAFSGIATEEQKLLWTRTKLVSFLQGLTNIEPVRIGKTFPEKKNKQGKLLQRKETGQINTSRIRVLYLAEKRFPLSSFQISLFVKSVGFS